MPEVSAVSAFLARWQGSGAAERANYQLFLSELCDLLGVPRPDPTRPDDKENAYVFERSVTFRHGDGGTSAGRIDLYRRGCFVLEAKQGSDRPGEADPLEARQEGVRWPGPRRGTAVRGTRGWDLAMLRARGQAEQYARALPAEEGWPPFLIVIDVGHAIELFADHSRTGRPYLPFPDPLSHRIPLADLADEAVRERLRLIWTAPQTLDPAKQSARVTRQVADRLALLARSFEQAGHSPETVGNFLKHCLFTMFAEDVGLIPNRKFTELLASLAGEAEKFAPLAASLWETMRDGGFSPVLREKLLRFNGGLFEDVEALPLTEPQLALLTEAGKADWRDVEPAIFGTLLERALDPRERHNLGAHYTPRDYVERLVLPTVIEPLREEWDTTLAAAVALDGAGDREGAVAEVKGYHRRLCGVKVLDPACGSGNFLYVTFEHLKRLEGEVLTTLDDLGETQSNLEMAGQTVDPHQLLGIEVNPRAAAITDLVLWIGYLQWHFRTHGQVMPPEPVIRKFHNIENRDAVLAWDAIEPLLDEQGAPVTRWDGVTTKTHPVTGEQVPDDTAREPVVRYVNPRAAAWPEADYVVGNPPFIGNKRMRQALGDGYVEALRGAWPEVPETADYVMYWWHYAAKCTRARRYRRFGFITTNSLTMAFNRQVVDGHLRAEPALSLAYAIPDHPWVDSADGAAVRIAMSVGRPGDEGSPGKLATVVAESDGDGEGAKVETRIRCGLLHADLSIGADVAGAAPLGGNCGLSFMGVILVGSGFVVAPGDPLLREEPGVVKRYLNGRDLTQVPRDCYVIDFFGIDEEEARNRYPSAFQRILNQVKPLRDQVKRESHRRDWLQFGEKRPAMRAALHSLARYIGTTETAKHRTFVFIDGSVLPDQKIRVIASDDAYVLGILSSQVHIVWALAAGGRMGVGNDPVYNNTRCFEPFPFPAASEGQRQGIRDLGERLDGHRKRQQALHPGLTLTGMYNVLEKLRAGEPLTAKEKAIHEQGLVSVLRQLHDELDAAVLEAYGWSSPASDGTSSRLSDEAILERLVALNYDRQREETQGLVRYLRPDYQQPRGGGQQAVQTDLDLPDEVAPAPAAAKGPTVKAPWPKPLPDQIRAIRQAILAADRPQTAKDLAAHFKHARETKVGELLTALAAIGQARETTSGKWTA